MATEERNPRLEWRDEQIEDTIAGVTAVLDAIGRFRLVRTSHADGVRWHIERTPVPKPPQT